jgi:hypothetical protein
MDAAARFRGPLQASTSPLTHAAKALRTATPLTIIRQDRPKDDPATGPAVRVSISRQTPAPHDARPLARRTGRDEPAIKRPTRQVVAEARTSSDNGIPDRIGPRDVATRIQGFGGLNVRRSTGGASLTPGD